MKAVKVKMGMNTEPANQESGKRKLDNQAATKPGAWTGDNLAGESVGEQILACQRNFGRGSIKTSKKTLENR